MASNIKQQPEPAPRSGSVPKAAPLSEAEASQLVLDSYLMQIQTQLCTCGNGERYSQLYEVWTHPVLTNSSRYHKLTPQRGWIDPSLALAYIELPLRQIPFCSDCVELRPLPAQTVSQPSREAWADTLRRKYQPAPTPTTAKPTPTLDML